MKKIKIYSEGAVSVPMYQTKNSAGVDLQSNSLSPILIKPSLDKLSATKRSDGGLGSTGINHGVK